MYFNFENEDALAITKYISNGLNMPLNYYIGVQDHAVRIELYCKYLLIRDNIYYNNYTKDTVLYNPVNHVDPINFKYYYEILIFGLLIYPWLCCLLIYIHIITIDMLLIDEKIDPFSDILL